MYNIYIYIYVCVCVCVWIYVIGMLGWVVKYSFWLNPISGARYSFVVRAFAHGAMGRRIDHSWGGPIELFLVRASAPRLM